MLLNTDAIIAIETVINQLMKVDYFDLYFSDITLISIVSIMNTLLVCFALAVVLPRAEVYAKNGSINIEDIADQLRVLNEDHNKLSRVSETLLSIRQTVNGNDMLIDELDQALIAIGELMHLVKLIYEKNDRAKDKATWIKEAKKCRDSYKFHLNLDLIELLDDPQRELKTYNEMSKGDIGELLARLMEFNEDSHNEEPSVLSSCQTVKILSIQG